MPSVEGNEPKHLNGVKGGAECKYSVLADRFDIMQEY